MLKNMCNENKDWLIFWISWLESYIWQNEFQELPDTLDKLKLEAKKAFNKTFEKKK